MERVADEARVRAALNTITDPCSAAAGMPVGIEELGLVRSLEVSDGPDGASVRVEIGVTEPGCLMGAPFAKEARKALEALPGVAEVEVGLDHAHDWSPADISARYQRFLKERRRVRRSAAGTRPG